jgi:caffeic acid 3-O-methyltransferase
MNPHIDLFTKVHGTSFFEYFKKDPQLNDIFNKSMTDTSAINMKKNLEIYRGFEGISTLVDVGGGNGQSLKAIISKYPSIKAINFDLPQVIENTPPFPGNHLITFKILNTTYPKLLIEIYKISFRD